MLNIVTVYQWSQLWSTYFAIKIANFLSFNKTIHAIDRWTELSSCRR